MWLVTSGYERWKKKGNDNNLYFNWPNCIEQIGNDYTRYMVYEL